MAMAILQAAAHYRTVLLSFAGSPGQASRAGSGLVVLVVYAHSSTVMFIQDMCGC